MLTPRLSDSGISSRIDLAEFSQTVLYGTTGRDGSHVTCDEPGITRTVPAPIQAAT